MLERLELLGDISILMSYTMPEKQREYEEALEGLEKKYPSLKHFIEEIKEGIEENPVSQLEDIERQIKEIEGLYGILPLLRSVGDLFGVDSSSMDFRTSAALEMCKSCKLAVSSGKEFHRRLVEEAKELSKERNVNPITAMKSQDFRNDVFKKVFPTREEAEKYIEQTHKSVRDMIELGRSMMKKVKRLSSSSAVSDERKEEIKQLPTHKALSVVQKAIMEYHFRELDKIY